MCWSSVLIIENFDIVCVFYLHCVIGLIKVCNNWSDVKINFITVGFILLLVSINLIKFWFSMSESFKLMTGTWDHWVSVVTMLVDDRVLISGRVGDFYVCHHIHTGSGTFQGLYKKNIKGLLTGAWSLPLSSIWCCQF